RTVIEAEHDDASDIRPEGCRISPLVGALRHPVHRALPTRLQKGTQPLGRLRDCDGCRDRDEIKAFGARAPDKRCLERLAAQKSRST
ncbi:MAG: hypothetical protein ACOVOA_13630, partial [Allorhizobium sp.]